MIEKGTETRQTAEKQADPRPKAAPALTIHGYSEAKRAHCTTADADQRA
jgi:hypothetical protein